MRLISGEVERRTPRSAKQKRERRQLLWLKGKRIPGGRETLPTSHLSLAFPARPERPPSCPSGQFEHSKRRWETMRRLWCWKDKKLSAVMPLLDNGFHTVTWRNCAASARGRVTGWIPHQMRDDGRGGYEAVPHLPPSCQTSAGTARRSGIQPVTLRNCTACACSTVRGWITGSSPVMTAEGNAKPCHIYLRVCLWHHNGMDPAIQVR